MKQIWKYRVEPPMEGTLVNIEMPADSLVLDIQVQGRDPVLWAVVDPELPKEVRTFAIFATGIDIPEFHKLAHVKTFQLVDAFRGSLVFHVFEVVR
jgi:hypothetical protein